MLCEQCNKNTATIHMKGLMNGEKTEMHLCQECSFNMVNMEMPISLENIFKGILESVQSMGGVQATIGQVPFPAAMRKVPGPCKVCELTYEQFKTGGKLGCEACYQAFPKEIVALFKNVQGSTHHEGKFPKRFGTQMRQQRAVDKLRATLKTAIDDENYEEAARIRDQIREMEVQA